MFDLIVSQGRAGDRAGRMIEGAALTARALEQRFGVQGQYVGQPAPPVEDDWTDSLPGARDTLLGIAEAIGRAVENDRLTVLASNTCSISIASLPVMARKHPDAVVLWIDAHGDFNTPETTGTGYLGGMALSAACGIWDSGHGSGVRPEQVVLVGARDIDAPERELLAAAGVRILPPAESTPENVRAAIGDAPVWVHIDWDVLEPGYIPADYEVPDGLLPDQVRDVLAAIPAGRLLGLEVAEFDAPTDAADAEKGVAAILDTIAPAFRA